MSYQVYKMLHIVSIVIFFSCFYASIQSNFSMKLKKILMGVMSLIILVAGMGLIARLGIPHGEPWPLWLKAKLGIWAVVVIGAPVVNKRFSVHAHKYFWVCTVLLVVASYMANYKI